MHRVDEYWGHGDDQKDCSHCDDAVGARELLERNIIGDVDQRRELDRVTSGPEGRSQLDG